MPAERVGVGLDEVLADRMEAWRVLAEHEGLRLCRTGPAGLRVRTPPGTVEAVLDAVLDNAVKFAPAGTEISVETGVGLVRCCSACGTAVPGWPPTSWNGPPTGSGAAPPSTTWTGPGSASRSR